MDPLKRQELESSENDFSEMDVKFRGKKEAPKKKEKVVEASEKSKSTPAAKPQSNFMVRTTYTLLMLFGFFLIVAAGPLYCVLFICLISILLFNELSNLKLREDKEKEIPWFRLINWYFFAITMYYQLGFLIKSKLPHLIFLDANVNMLMKYHNVIFFMLWSFGFVAFTLSLKPGFYKYQLRHFGWTHLGSFFMVSTTGFMMHNLCEGMVWFLLPCTLVVANDIFAYIFGFFFGTHKLIQLSPKKTWEGFIGGAVCSILWAFLVSTSATWVPALICPQRSFSVLPFDYETCTYPSYYTTQPYPLPLAFNSIGFENIWISEFNQHAMVMSLFASLIAPFGGFFASGVKRALKIKDFGDVIPGHGGLIDRFDCQLINGAFAYVYIHSIILAQSSTMGALISFIDSLSGEDKVEIYNHLKMSIGN